MPWRLTVPQGQWYFSPSCIALRFGLLWGRCHCRLNTMGKTRIRWEHCQAPWPVCRPIVPYVSCVRLPRASQSSCQSLFRCAQNLPAVLLSRNTYWESLPAQKFETSNSNLTLLRPQEATAKIDEYARGMISGSGSTLFEELGLYYIGPIDGHDLDLLVTMLQGMLRSCPSTSHTHSLCMHLSAATCT